MRSTMAKSGAKLCAASGRRPGDPPDDAGGKRALAQIHYAGTGRGLNGRAECDCWQCSIFLRALGAVVGSTGGLGGRGGIV